MATKLILVFKNGHVAADVLVQCLGLSMEAMELENAPIPIRMRTNI